MVNCSEASRRLSLAFLFNKGGCLIRGAVHLCLITRAVYDRGLYGIFYYMGLFNTGGCKHNIYMYARVRLQKILR